MCSFACNRVDLIGAEEETFGPVAGLFPFKTESEVVGLANDAEVGLAGYFYSKDIGRIYRVAEAMEVGMIGVNTVSSTARRMNVSSSDVLISLLCRTRYMLTNENFRVWCRTLFPLLEALSRVALDEKGRNMV